MPAPLFIWQAYHRHRHTTQLQLILSRFFRPLTSNYKRCRAIPCSPLCVVQSCDGTFYSVYCRHCVCMTLWGTAHPYCCCAIACWQWGKSLLPFVIRQHTTSPFGHAYQDLSRGISPDRMAPAVGSSIHDTPPLSPCAKVVSWCVQKFKLSNKRFVVKVILVSRNGNVWSSFYHGRSRMVIYWEIK